MQDLRLRGLDLKGLTKWGGGFSKDGATARGLQKEYEDPLSRRLQKTLTLLLILKILHDPSIL